MAGGGVRPPAWLVVRSVVAPGSVVVPAAALALDLPHARPIRCPAVPSPLYVGNLCRVVSIIPALPTPLASPLDMSYERRRFFPMTSPRFTLTWFRLVCAPSCPSRHVTGLARILMSVYSRFGSRLTDASRVSYTTPIYAIPSLAFRVPSTCCLRRPLLSPFLCRPPPLPYGVEL